MHNKGHYRRIPLLTKHPPPSTFSRLKAGSSEGSRHTKPQTPSGQAGGRMHLDLFWGDSKVRTKSRTSFVTLGKSFGFSGSIPLSII